MSELGWWCAVILVLCLMMAVGVGAASAIDVSTGSRACAHKFNVYECSHIWVPNTDSTTLKKYGDENE